jgi:hypothetical protein
MSRLPYFDHARQRYIVVRHVTARFQRTKEPFDHEGKDVKPMSDLCRVV